MSDKLSRELPKEKKQIYKYLPSSKGVPKVTKALNISRYLRAPFLAFCGKSLLRAQNQSDFHQIFTKC
jgi:hypothetical protein